MNERGFSRLRLRLSRSKSKSDESVCCSGGVELDGRAVFWKGLRNNETRPTCWGTL